MKRYVIFNVFFLLIPMTSIAMAASDIVQQLGLSEVVSIESTSCFGPNRKLKLVDQETAGKKFPDSIGFARQHYQMGLKYESSNQGGNALGHYILSEWPFKAQGMSFAPGLIGNYRIASHFTDKEIAKYDSALKTFQLLSYFRKVLILEKVRRSYDNFGKTVEAKKDKNKIQNTAIAFLDMIIRVVMGEKYLIEEDESGVLFLGTQQIAVLGRGLAEYGVVLHEGKWEILKKNQLPEIEQIQEEKRGIFKDRAYRFSSTASFIPGLKTLGNYKKMDAEDIWWNIIIGENWLEYSFFDHTLDERRNKAFLLLDTGLSMDLAGNKEQMATKYIQAITILGLQFTEPLVRLYNSDSLKDNQLADIAKVSFGLIKQVESVRSTLLGLYVKAKQKGIDLAPFNAALYHSYWIKNMVIGRIFPVLPIRNKHISPVMNVGFVSEWLSGMNKHGVKIPPKNFSVGRLSEVDVKRRENYISKGFWEGCWSGKNGEILVPGIEYLNGLLLRN